MRHQLFLGALGLVLMASLATPQNQPSPFQKFGCDYSRQDALRIVHAEVPLYPVVALQAGLAGTVKVHVVIEGGKIVTAEPMPGANPPLAVSAQTNIQTWRFADDGYGEFCVTYIYELDRSHDPKNPTVEMDFPNKVKITTSPAAPIAIY